ncbi:MAG TPA: hypothetical protein VFW33_07585 [Gemmataceae bacterium]|nr:hypothetical protein [Gemmataceae bacterium]
MDSSDQYFGNDSRAYEITRNHLVHFTTSDARCRGVELPEGLLLRYTLTKALYFYLRTGIRDGKIFTRVYASDSPYDRQKSPIGDVSTPIFEPRADMAHLVKVQKLLHAWVEFVKESPDDEVAFQNFPIEENRNE